MESFECSLCFEAKTQTSTYHIDGGPVCGECISEYIVPLFESALASETQYPVRWGATELDITPFQDAVGSDFVRSYRQRAAEYAVPGTDRIYCAHRMLASVANEHRKGSSTTKQLALTPDQLADAEEEEEETVACGAMVGQCSASEGRKLLCYHCRGRVCGTCESPLLSVTQGHDCRTRPRTERLARSVETEGLTRGRDFQFCPKPKCGNAVGHDKGCNHMTCNKCATSFCFLCGELAHYGDGHWPDKCPLFGLPEATGELPEGIVEAPPGLPELPADEPEEEPAGPPPFFTQPIQMMQQIRSRSHLIRSMPVATRFNDLSRLATLMHENIEWQRTPLASITDDAVPEVIETLRVRDEEVQVSLNKLPFTEIDEHLPLLARVIWFYAEYRQRLFVDVLSRLESLAGKE